MLTLFETLLDRKPLHRAARAGNSEQLRELLRNTDVVVIAEPRSPDGLEGDGLEGPGDISATSQDRNGDVLRPLVYEAGGKTWLPVFSDHESAECFGGALRGGRAPRDRRNLRALEVPGTAVAGLARRFDEVVLDPRCRDEVVFGPALVEALAADATGPASGRSRV